jgi:hypothetical protein
MFCYKWACLSTISIVAKPDYLVRQIANAYPSHTQLADIVYDRFLLNRRNKKDKPQRKPDATEKGNS